MPAGDREPADLARFDVRQHRGRARVHQMHLAAHQVGQRLGRTFIGHVHNIHSGHGIEKGARKMAGASAAGGGVIELAGFGFRQRDEFLDGFRR